MPRKTTGIYFDEPSQRWVINRQHRGRRIFERTAFGPEERDQAEKRLFSLLAEEDALSGPLSASTTFRQAATRYLNTHGHKRSISRDAEAIKAWDPLIGTLPITHIHQGIVAAGIARRRETGVRTGTIRREIATIRQILTACCLDWRDDRNRPLLAAVPRLKCPDFEDAAKPHILTTDEQQRLLAELPPHLSDMALFALHTGLRDRTICGLRWAWYRDGQFVIPGRPDGSGWTGEKSKRDHTMPLNRVAKKIVEARRGEHDTHVFTYHGEPIDRMNNSAWRKAWRRAGLPEGERELHGPHNLRHTFGRRMEEAGVDFEVRQVLMGHASGRVTHIYSPVNLRRMMDALELLAK